jgi:hypothetical protein
MLLSDNDGQLSDSLLRRCFFNGGSDSVGRFFSSGGLNGFLHMIEGIIVGALGMSVDEDRVASEQVSHALLASLGAANMRVRKRADSARSRGFISPWHLGFDSIQSR